MFKKIMGFVLAFSIFSSIAFVPLSANALSQKVLVLSQAQILALNADFGIKKQQNKIVLQRMKYIESVAEIQAKIKNLTTFRWSPLLSFKFPQKLDLVDEFDLHTTPTILQIEISKLEHELSDMKYSVTETVTTQFLTVYSHQEKIAFEEERLEILEEELERNEARLITGQANQADIDSMKSSIEATISSLATMKRNYENDKKKLSDIIGIDVTSNYIFSNPLSEATLPREALPQLTEWTLANDHLLFTTKLDASIGLITLNSYDSLMRSQYGSDMSGLDSYIASAKTGADMDTAAFKMAYDRMLVAVDSKWAGSIRILFINIPKLWFKGAIDGTRYIEDEIYALYTATLDYNAAVKEVESVTKDLTTQINDGYENLITVQKAYEETLRLVDETKKQLDKMFELNKLGKASFDELKGVQDDYAQVQVDLMDALALYTTTITNYDRLTCGFVSSYLNGVNITTDAGVAGDSYAEIDKIDKPYYFIETSVQDMIFTFGVDIPEDYEPAVSDFELWYDGIQIGARTPNDETIRHLAIDYGESNTLIVRLYDGQNFVAECEVSTMVYRDVLPIPFEKAEEPTLTPVPIGSYKMTTRTVSDMKVSTLSVTPNSDVEASFYKLVYTQDSKALAEKLIPIDSDFAYLSLLSDDLELLTIELYDAEETLIESANFDTETQTFYILELKEG